AAPRREAIDRHGRRHGEHGRGGVSLPPVLAEHRGAGAASLAAPAPKHSSRGGGLVPGTSRRVGERPHAPQAVGELCVRPRSAGSDRAGRTNQGVPGAARRLDCRRALRALLFLRKAPVKRLLLGLAVLSRSEEHTSELQSLAYLVCRLLLEKKKYYANMYNVFYLISTSS